MIFPVFDGFNDGEDLPDSRLKDGNWDCVASTDEHTQHVLVHIKGDKVGLYDAPGKGVEAGRKEIGLEGLYEMDGVEHQRRNEPVAHLPLLCSRSAYRRDGLFSPDGCS